MSFRKEFVKGLWDEIPVFRVVLGMCPTLAVTTKVENGIGMGLAATFVLLFSNIAVSALRNVIPSKVRIPCFIIIAATFTTMVDLLMNAFAHDVHKSLGIFIPLIVVNCIILGRAEAYAARNRVAMSVADALGMGLGFTIALIVVSGIREIIGDGAITVWGSIGFRVPSYQPLLILILAPGGFVTLGMLLALMNHIQFRIARRNGTTFTPPEHLGCRNCMACGLSGKQTVQQ
jgi:electron transport complex protein RnfE